MSFPNPIDPRVVYSSAYDIHFLGLERLHPFDGRKFTRAWRYARRLLGPEIERRTLCPRGPISREQLLAVHTPEYLARLRSSRYVAQAVEMPGLAWFPAAVLDCRILRPMRFGTTGTLLAARAALQGGLAYNLAGGYHHASQEEAEGFCFYADIHVSLAALRQAGELHPGERILIIDLDAHQGNGHERLSRGDPDLFIVDLYNRDIYPQDFAARRRINIDRPLPSGTGDTRYLRVLRDLLPQLPGHGPFKLAFYIAGTDIYEADLLGGLNISGDALLTRDRLVLTTLQSAGIPVAVLAGGGYGPRSYQQVANSLCYFLEQWGDRASR
ncbi:MAG: histone deacetylase [Anaerolineales bacterium]|nr:histone deacetylase [Anaerolineales bacterium]